MITIRFKSIKTYDNIFKLKTEDDEDDLEIYFTLHDMDQGFDHLYSIRSFLPCFLGGRFPCSSVLFRVLLGLLVGFTAFAAFLIASAFPRTCSSNNASNTSFFALAAGKSVTPCSARIERSWVLVNLDATKSADKYGRSVDSFSEGIVKDHL